MSGVGTVVVDAIARAEDVLAEMGLVVLDFEDPKLDQLIPAAIADKGLVVVVSYFAGQLIDKQDLTIRNDLVLAVNSSRGQNETGVSGLGVATKLLREFVGADEVGNPSTYEPDENTPLDIQAPEDEDLSVYFVNLTTVTKN